jgi:hypothetical protein
MTSNWTLPTSVTQYAEIDAENIHVSWLTDNDFHSIKNRDNKFVKTSRDLLHIAKQPKHDLVEKTYFLKATGFNFTQLPEIVSGIEMRLTMNRHGRISDETIQLCLNDQTIGDNQAKLKLDPITIYGTETDKWGSGMDIFDIQNNNFGVLLRFQSHPNWPHKCSAFLGAIEIRVH